MRRVDLTCIRCPMGCALAVEVDAEGAVASVSGNRCARGRSYGAAEATHPVRTVTACVCVPGVLEPLSAKTAEPVPRPRVREVARAISVLEVRPPVRIGDVLCDDVAGTGVAVVATKSLG